MVLASIGLDTALAPLLPVAVLMVGFQLALLFAFLPRPSDPTRPRLSRAILIVYLVPATALMWVVLPAAVLDPSYASWWAAIQAMMVPMPAPFLWMMSQLARAEERRIDRSGWFWPLLLGGGVVANEALMGYAFAALAGASGLDTLPGAVGTSLNSVWFAAAMMATMLALVLWIPLGIQRRVVLTGLAGSAWVGPAWVVDPVLGSLVMAIVMPLILGGLVWGLARPTELVPRTPRAFSFTVGAAVAGMTLAAAGSIAAPELFPSGVLIAAAGAAVMLGESVYLVREGLAAVQDPTPPFVWDAAATVPV